LFRLYFAISVPEKKHRCLPQECYVPDPLLFGEMRVGSWVIFDCPLDDLQLPRIKFAISQKKKKRAQIGFFSPFVKNTALVPRGKEHLLLKQ
jgi:hypothetical protein